MFENNKIRHVLRVIIACFFSGIISYFISLDHPAWVLLSTIGVMCTSTGSALYQGLWRSLFIIMIATVFSLGSHSVLIDALIGILIGIGTNILVFRDRVDDEFRKKMIPVLSAYADYFSAIVNLLINKNEALTDTARRVVQYELKKLPYWIYETGFDLGLQKSYRYFYMKIVQIGEILFSMHYLARYHYPPDMLQAIQKPLFECAERAKLFFIALSTVLELKKPSESVSNFIDCIVEINQILAKNTPLRLELLSITKEEGYLTELSYFLKELQEEMVRLAATLR